MATNTPTSINPPLHFHQPIYIRPFKTYTQIWSENPSMVAKFGLSRTRTSLYPRPFVFFSPPFQFFGFQVFSHATTHLDQPLPWNVEIVQYIYFLYHILPTSIYTLTRLVPFSWLCFVLLVVYPTRKTHQRLFYLLVPCTLSSLFVYYYFFIDRSWEEPLVLEREVEVYFFGNMEPRVA